jgi:hypothetical protein
MFVTLIDWCLTPTLAIFELYHGVFYIEQRLFCAFAIYLISSSSLHYALFHPYLHLADTADQWFTLNTRKECVNRTVMPPASS